MSQRALRIYVAGPYTAPTAEGRLRNTNVAIELGIKLWKKGHYPYIPHLTHYIDEHASRIGVPMDYEEYLEMDTEWLKLCDALLYYGSSRGADLELENAKLLGLTIFESIDQVDEVKSRM